MTDKAKLTINRPRSAIEGWTGHLTLPSGERINLSTYCGGGRVAFSTRQALITNAKRVLVGYNAIHGA